MNATELLKSDHDKVNKLFTQFEGANSERTKRDLCKEIVQELKVHTQIEEEIFYPAVRKQGRLEDLLREAHEEHGKVKQLISKMEGLEPSDREYDSTMREIKQDVEHHVREEEGKMFPKVEQQMASELQSLGTQLQERKQKLLSSKAMAS
jgi:hemerythrin superfamily protein